MNDRKKSEQIRFSCVSLENKRTQPKICIIEKQLQVWGSTGVMRMLDETEEGHEKKALREAKADNKKTERKESSRRGKTVARNIDYGEIRIFLLHKFQWVVMRGGKATTTKEGAKTSSSRYHKNPLHSTPTADHVY